MAPTGSLPVIVPRRGVVTLGSRDGEVNVVWLHGEYDVTTVDALAQTLARAIAFDNESLIVDLSMVGFMDGATVGVIIRAQEFLAARSQALALRGAFGEVRRVLEVCGAGALLDRLASKAAPTAGNAGALGSWVAVPATERPRRVKTPRTSTSTLSRHPSIAPPTVVAPRLGP